MRFCVPVYSVSIHDRIESDLSLWEESFLIVDEVDAEAAITKVRRLAAENQTQYHNQSGENIRWELRTVGCPKEVPDPITDGVEIYSRFLRASEVTSLQRPFEE